MATEWYYQVMGDVVGPSTPQQLKQLAETRTILPDTLVGRSPDGPWVLAERVQGLFVKASGTTPSAAPSNVELRSRPPVIAQPIPSNSATRDESFRRPPSSTESRDAPSRIPVRESSKRVAYLLSAMTFLVVIFAGGGAWYWWRNAETAAPRAANATPVTQNPSPNNSSSAQATVPTAPEPFNQQLFANVLRVAAEIESTRVTDSENLRRLNKQMSVEIKLLENAVKAQSERNVLKLIEHYSEIRAGHGFLTDYRQGIAKNWKPLSNDDRKTFARLGGQKIIAQREEIDDMVSKGYLPIMGEGGLSQACREVLTKLSIPIQETKLASYFSVEYLDTLDKLSAAEFKTISILINNNGVPPK